MKKRLVIDSSVYIVYIFYNKLYRIANAINIYNLEVFVDQKLINELERNLILKSIRNLIPHIAIEELLKFSIFFDSQSIFKDCPDPKDNFLFDLAIQTNSDILVTEEKIY